VQLFYEVFILLGVHFPWLDAEETHFLLFSGKEVGINGINFGYNINNIIIIGFWKEN
jgi:hypothetical protein